MINVYLQIMLKERLYIKNFLHVWQLWIYQLSLFIISLLHTQVLKLKWVLRKDFLDNQGYKFKTA